MTARNDHVPMRHHLEDAQDVVDSGVVAPLLVAVVKPVDAGEHDPEGQADDE